jgi:predicted RNA binding protein YcfA (HicA-like mRNA interferase family)
MPLKPKQMVKLLEKNGFIKDKSPDGSHQRFYNPKTGKSTVVPIHSKELGKGLEQKILKQAGLKK